LYNYRSTIYIFDRYGKLLKQLSTTEIGWDGTYNGHQMPADDYWYSIQFEDGRSAKGHFTLKR
jgi:gliding motility-associated-like protein